MLRLPRTSDVEEALLHHLQNAGGKQRSSDVYGPLGDLFGLTYEEQTAPMPNQNERHWDNRVRTARKHLVERQLLDNSEHGVRSEEHTSELQSLMRSSYAVFCLKKKTQP